MLRMSRIAIGICWLLVLPLGLNRSALGQQSSLEERQPLELVLRIQ
jgi:hypothetical protein